MKQADTIGTGHVNGSEGAGRRLTADERREGEVRLLLRFVRASFFVLITIVTLLSVIEFQNNESTGEFEIAVGILWWVPLLVALGLGLVVLAVDLLTPNKRISTFSGVVFGLLIGVMTAFMLGFVVDLVATSWEFYDNETVQTVKVLAGICVCYLAVAFVMQTQDDIRLAIPYVEFAKQIRGQRPLILDSSALIDGRLVGLVETGLIQAPMLVPRFVLGELQQLSDSGDKTKRSRGRRGLDMVSNLQRLSRADVTIDETVIAGNAVDQMLVELGRQVSGVIVTTDSGLARVAGIEGVGVVNLHDVASVMRPSVVSGERLRVKLIKHGEQPGQGVGYLDDGTMVVAEDGEDHIGKEMDLFVTTSLQTSAGRLIFARTTVEAGLDAAHVAEAETKVQVERAVGPGGASAARREGRNPRR